MSIPIFLAINATFFAAGTVKGVTGMGLPMVAIGVLGALISPLAAASLLIVPSFVTNVWQLLSGPDFRAVIRRLWSMMLAICVGTMLGVSWLTSGDAAATTSLLGIALVTYAGYTLLARQLAVGSRLEPVLSTLIGGLTGIVSGETGVFVIPAVPYLQALVMSQAGTSVAEAGPWSRGQFARAYNKRFGHNRRREREHPSGRPRHYVLTEWGG